MVATDFRRVYFFVFLFFLVPTVAYSSYPELEFDQLSYPSGQVDVLAKASPGTKVSLYINDNFIGEQEVYGNNVDIVLEGESIYDIDASIYSNVIFRNDDPSRVYKINVSSGPYKELVVGDTLIVPISGVVEDIEYKDEQTGDVAYIRVRDMLGSVNFTNTVYSINDEMNDGENVFKFLQKYPAPTYEEELDYVFDVDFEKFSNKITITNYTNVTDVNSVYIEGYVSDSRYPLYYLKNIRPSDAGNLAVMGRINLSGAGFNITVPDLREGDNTIYFVTTAVDNRDVFTGQEEALVIVDTFAPEIDIVDAVYIPRGSDRVGHANFDSNVFINDNNLELNISTDAIILNYTFNSENYSLEVDNETVIVDLNLEEGQNNLTLIAIDAAGNIGKEQHNIFYSGIEPEIYDDSLKPEKMFESGVSHFFYQEIEGRTNRPNMEITIFTIAEDTKTRDGERVDCSDFEPIYYRNLGQLDHEDVDGPELNLNETQVSLTNLMFQRTTVETDSDGEFEASIILQEKSFDYGDYDDARDRDRDRNPEIDTVETDNRICFIMRDKYGYVESHEERVELDAGNTLWDSREIVTIPNSIYASEIENTGDEREGTGFVEFGVMAVFQYIGAGKVNEIRSFRVFEDDSLMEHRGSVRIDRSNVKYKYDVDTGEMITYFRVEVRPLGIDPLEYPDELDLAFKAIPTYSVGDKDVPIDTQNPIYFQTKVNIEKPLDSTKWLTPEMIDDSLEFLNKSIKFTESAVKWTGTASTVGVLACTAAKFWHAAEIAQAQSVEEIEDADRRLYEICDRVACTAAPPDCSDSGESILGQGFEGDINEYLKGEKTGEVDLNPLNSQVYNGDKLVGNVESLKFAGECDLPMGDKKGVIISVKSSLVNQSESYSLGGRGLGYVSSEKTGTMTNCVDRDDIAMKDGDTYTGISASKIGGGNICYSEEMPFYDDLRCKPIPYSDISFKDRDPATSILSSVMCGCITDTYSHLKNWLKIQESIKGCLEQAKIGETKGSYCERLMGMAVCDVATNIVLPEVMKQYRSAPGIDNSAGSRNVNFLDSIRKTDKAMNNRYKGTILSQSGLQTSDIVNKACVGAITRDWSVLTENVLTAIDQNEVEPVFGPMFPTSRVQGYNPLNGQMSIMYRFTYGAVSGGQTIRTEFKLICDKNAPNGEYCPPGITVVDEIGNDRISPQYVREGESVQDTVVLTDSEARFWFNKIQATHTYTLKGKKVTRTFEEDILHKGEIAPQCYFGAGPSAGAGFWCDTIFGDEALISRYVIRDDTDLTPSDIFYPGNQARVKLSYDIKGEGDQDKFNLHYLAVCRSTQGGDSESVAISYQPIKVTKGNEEIYDHDSPYGVKLVDIFKVPDRLGVETDTSLTTLKMILSEKFERGQEYSFNVTNLDTEKLKTLNFRIKMKKDIICEREGDSCVANSNKFKPNSLISLTLNPGESKTMDFFIKNDATDKDLEEEREFEIAIENDFEDVSMVINKILGENAYPIDVSKSPKEQLGATVTEEFQSLAAGPCKLYLRILPDGVAPFSTVDEFKGYKEVGDDTLTNVESSELFDLDFRIANTPSSADRQTYDFDLVKPFESASYCINSNGNLRENAYMLYAAQASDNDLEKKGLLLTYELLSNQVKGSLLENSNKEEEIESNEDRIDLDIDTEKLAPIVDDGRIEAQLEYKLYEVKTDEDDKEDSSNWELVSGYPKTRKVYISECDSDLDLPTIPDVQSGLEEVVGDDDEDGFGDIQQGREEDDDVPETDGPN